MTDHDETTAESRAESRAHGADVDGLVTLPGVSSPSGEEKAGTGDDPDADGRDPASAHVASDHYVAHRRLDGPPSPRR